MRGLTGVVRTYAWGSRTALAELAGRRSPADHPEAELWFGAHPADPALLEDGSTLLDYIETEPIARLGAAVAQGFGETLPFLVKILAAEQPLSLQAHPSRAQAEAGFDWEEAQGIAITDPKRNYRDRNHKPELVVALTEFVALAGFRPAADTLRFLRDLDLPELEMAIGLLTAQPDSDGLRVVFTTQITMPTAVTEKVVAAVLDGCARYLRTHGKQAEFGPAARVVLTLGEGYPGDAGVLAALLLNTVILEPGTGLYLPAGNLHAYISGVCVEVMASSDNVLRGGFTPKNVDVPELLKVLDFTEIAPADLLVLTEPVAGHDDRPESTGRIYRSPTPEFSVGAYDLVPGRPLTLPAPTGPEVLVAVGAAVRVNASVAAGADVAGSDAVGADPAGSGEVVVPSGCGLWRDPADGPGAVVPLGPVPLGPDPAVARPGASPVGVGPRLFRVTVGDPVT